MIKIQWKMKVVECYNISPIMSIGFFFQTLHYANMSVQYTAIFHDCKMITFVR